MKTSFGCTLLMGAACLGATTAAAVNKAPAQAVADAASLFGQRPAIAGAALSPDGAKVLYLAADSAAGTELMIAASDASAAPAPALASDGVHDALRWCDWADDKRIVCEVTGATIVDGLRLGFQRLIAVDPDGKNVMSLSQRGTGQALRISQADGGVVDWEEGTTGKLLIARDHVPERTIGTHLAQEGDGLGVDQVDTHTLASTPIEAPNQKASDYLGDGKGSIRLMAVDNSTGGYLTGTSQWFYRRPHSSKWEAFSTIRMDGPGLRPISIDYATDTVYCLDRKDGRDKLYRVALDGSMKSELLFADQAVDVDDVLRLGRQARVIGVSTSAERGDVVYLDPGYRSLAAALSKALPKLPTIDFESSNADETKLLLSAGSDDDAGRYYVFDKATKHLNEIALVRPQLEHVALAAMTPVSFKASDGSVIPAYLTLPPSGAAKNLPAIVMPHGGPASHDSWGFDWLVQFFAHQGYAVLQPEYRGSTGYGDAWRLQNGFRSWRTAIGDVVDAGRWLVAQGIADPSKLAIVGWSYGGYAALQSNVVNPDLFKAVVAIAPVTDLEALKNEAIGFTNHAVVSDYIGSGPDIAQGSPARHADMFKAPVLMFHGTVDQNVGVGETRLMDAKLRAAGKQSTIVIYPDLDHQLDSGEIRADLLRRADAFLKTSMHMEN